MAKTKNIGLNLTDNDSTRFEDWRESIDGNGSGVGKSNMQIIDEEFGKIGAGLRYVEADGKIYLVNTKGEIVGEGIPMPKDGVGIIDIKLIEV